MIDASMDAPAGATTVPLASLGRSGQKQSAGPGGRRRPKALIHLQDRWRGDHSPGSAANLPRHAIRAAFPPGEVENQPGVCHYSKAPSPAAR